MPSAKGYAKEGHRVRLKMLLPVRDRFNLLFQLLEVGAQVCARVLDELSCIDTPSRGICPRRPLMLISSVIATLPVFRRAPEPG